MLSIIGFIGGLVLGGGAIYFYVNNMSKNSIQHAADQSDKIITEAKLKAENARKEIEIKSKDDMSRQRSNFDKENNRKRNEVNQMEQGLVAKQARLEEKEKNIDKRDNEISSLKNSLSSQRDKVDTVYKEQVDKLENIAGLSKEDAVKTLMDNLERDLKGDAGGKIREYETYIKQVADKKATEIISLALNRCASETVTDATTSIVTLPNDDLKGRIIGKEGRNIRVFESLTGIDLIVDDTPDTVILSGFDPIRREIARLTLVSLVSDGRIHPSRIEETVEKVRKELRKKIIEVGAKTAEDMDIRNLDPKMIELVGRMQYRTSYGQNILNHSVEVANLASFIAQELGVNHVLAKRAGFLHDIGKAIDFELEGTHTQIGAALMKKYGESDEVIHAMICHHDEVEPQTIEAMVVTVADALSASRPGARQEAVETHIKRLTQLEAIAGSFMGVEKSFAIQAGREIRVMVKSDQVSDKESPKLAHDIAKKIENELEYPGHIKVSVIRENRFSSVAK